MLNTNPFTFTPKFRFFYYIKPIGGKKKLSIIKKEQIRMNREEPNVKPMFSKKHISNNAKLILQEEYSQKKIYEKKKIQGINALPEKD